MQAYNRQVGRTEREKNEIFGSDLNCPGQLGYGKQKYF